MTELMEEPGILVPCRDSAGQPFWEFKSRLPLLEGYPPHPTTNITERSD